MADEKLSGVVQLPYPKQAQRNGVTGTRKPLVRIIDCSNKPKKPLFQLLLCSEFLSVVCFVGM
jgi:hypothetical protein